MKTKNLSQLNNWLSSKSENYICMIADGSIAVGDKLVEGRSDHDILLIFEKITNKDLDNLEIYFNKADFDDTYLFNVFSREFFVKERNSSHDFSGKFRSKVLYGKNIIGEVELPNKKVANKIYKEGLMNVQRRLKVRLLNSGFWSVKKIRDTFWQLFKHAFMNLAIKTYCDKGEYPKTREEVVTIYNSGELKLALKILNSIDKSSKKEIIESANLLNKFLINLK